jgi:hypothetical protein
VKEFLFVCLHSVLLSLFSFTQWEMSYFRIAIFVNPNAANQRMAVYVINKSFSSTHSHTATGILILTITHTQTHTHIHTQARR